MDYYDVKAGIWERGPVVFLDAGALESFGERGAYMIYDPRNQPSRTISARITDNDIRFFVHNTNEPTQLHIIPPMENGPRGFSGLIQVHHEISRTHDVRCHLFNVHGYWDDTRDEFVVTTPALPHLLPYPNKKDLTVEMILADIDARRAAAKRFTGRSYVSFPNYYLDALTPEKRMAIFGRGTTETGECAS
jgi:hypothetical protein